MAFAGFRKIAKDDINVQSSLKDYVERISVLYPQARLVAFGSLARDQLTAASDLDLAMIVSDEISPKDAYRKMKAVNKPVPMPVDLLVFRKSDFEVRSNIGGVCFDIREDGKELYPNWELA